MDILDVIIVVFLIAFAASGLRRGLTGVALSLAGLLAGLFLGAVIAPPIARAITQDRTTQPMFAIGVFVGVALLVEGIGAAIGFRIRQRTQRTVLLGKADAGVGAVLGLLSALATAWYLGLMFSQSPWVTLDNQITNSTIERSLDGFMPRPPGFLATIGNLFRSGDFPNPFSTILNIPQAPLAIPPLVDTPGIREATSVTVKVIAAGCGGGAEAGSSWPLAPGYFVTNAHVVAGSNSVEIDTPSGDRRNARVVLFDPDTDLAVLFAPGLSLRPLVVLDTTPVRGTSGAVIGYPGGGREQVVPAAVSGTESATGYNIYGDTLVTRKIEVLAAQVIPGNSGGPIVNVSGQVIGVVFAANTTEPNVGYALTIPQVSPDLQAGEHRTAGVSTQSCTG
ncbi:MAG: MarP family serine protease [Candidatus Dormiibacterota bacterium]